MKSLFCLAVVASLTLPFLSGCGPGKDQGSFSGKAAFSPPGPILPQAVVMTLHPTKSGVPTVVIPLKADGSFSHPGVPAGEMKVTFKVYFPGSEMMQPTAMPGKDPAVEMAKMRERMAEEMRKTSGGVGEIPNIASKYGDPATTPLSCTIINGSNEKDFTVDAEH